jgi:hypothetical protein
VKRRSFLAQSAVAAFSPALAQGPGSAGPAPLAEPHFPSRLHQFVWRNWEVANLDRMARAVKAAPAAMREIGESMGLPPKPQLSPEVLRRIYVTVIRQNWHLLPLEQITELLGWTREKLDFTLKEDDFLDVKLGPKPVCDPVLYAPPSEAERRRAGEIRTFVRSVFGLDLALKGEPAFDFVARLSRADAPRARRTTAEGLDLSRFELEPGGPANVSALLERQLRAFGASPGQGVKVKLKVDIAAPPGTFSIEPARGVLLLRASGEDALFQAVRYLQDAMESAGAPFVPSEAVTRKVSLDPRYLYSFFALYGDPLLEPEIDPFPDGYLDRLASAGINGVWMQCVLNTLTPPSRSFPEFGARADERLANLEKLVERAHRLGVRVFLYVNEPRAMRQAFFAGRRDIQGAEYRGLYAMCTTVPSVREWISESLAHVFERVPGLGGVFSISMTENLTNCFSRGTQKTCPRCSTRTSWDVVGEVLESIRQGVRRSSATAEVIAWDWGWPQDMCRNLIPKLPRDTRLLSVSEWSAPIDRGGVKTAVDEYSISVVGPGPRATANWALATEAGVRTMAKTQFNNTWEISAVPYIPAVNLVAQHCANLVRSGIGGIMAGWTLGGYPSPNLEVAKEFYSAPAPRVEDVLRRVAVRRYGAKAAGLALRGWAGFSDAFRHYPYSVAIYVIPTQHGPANLLRAVPTGVPNSMILFPQDNYKNWAGKYSPEVVFREFSKMASLWRAALPGFRQAMEIAAAEGHRIAREDQAIAETCWIHFQSTANQVEFYILRDGPRTPAARERMRALAAEEIELARRLYPLARQHSVIAFEASNHYFYRPADLVEKAVNCRYLLDRDLKG